MKPVDVKPSTYINMCLVLHQQASCVLLCLLTMSSNLSIYIFSDIEVMYL